MFCCFVLVGLSLATVETVVKIYLILLICLFHIQLGYEYCIIILLSSIRLLMLFLPLFKFPCLLLGYKTDPCWFLFVYSVSTIWLIKVITIKKTHCLLCFNFGDTKELKKHKLFRLKWWKINIFEVSISILSKVGNLD